MNETAPQKANRWLTTIALAGLSYIAWQQVELSAVHSRQITELQSQVDQLTISEDNFRWRLDHHVLHTR